MKRSLIIRNHLLFSAAFSLAAILPAQNPPAWRLPNFSDRLEVALSNPSDRAVDAVAVIPIAEATRVALRFPGTFAIAVLPGPPSPRCARADRRFGQRRRGR